MEGPEAELPTSFFSLLFSFGPTLLLGLSSAPSAACFPIYSLTLATPFPATPLPVPALSQPHSPFQPHISAIALLLSQPSYCSPLQPRHPFPCQAGLPGFSPESSASLFPSLSPTSFSSFFLSCTSINPAVPAASSSKQHAYSTHIPPPPQSQPTAPPSPARDVYCHWLTPL